MAYYEPNETHSRMAELMAACGVPQEDIAYVMKIDVSVLRKHYEYELKAGLHRANHEVAKTLYNQATEGKNIVAAIFWLKTRAGWREKDNEAPTSLTINIVEKSD